jgi:dCTP deaminase
MSILADKQIKNLCTNYHYKVEANNKKIPSKSHYKVYDDENSVSFGFVGVPSPILKKAIIQLNKLFDIEEKNHLIVFPEDAFGVEYIITIVPNKMIVPYIEHSVKLNEAGKKIPSYGQSSYGYDVRTGRNYKRLPIIEGALNAFTDIVDTIDFVDQMETINDVDYIDIPPHGFVLGTTVEKFDLPHDTMVIFTGKSTLARMGLSIFCTPAEPGWSGYITTEIFNATPRTVRLHSGIGLMQAIFFKGSEHCDVNYSDRGGKYNNQIAMPVSPIN